MMSRLWKHASLVAVGLLVITSIFPALAAAGGEPLTVKADNARVVVVIPPQGFEAVTATKSDLAKYGFPQQPSQRSQIPAWTEAMQAAITFVPPTFRQGPRRNDTQQGQATTSDTANWSGQVTNAGNFTSVEGEWNVPNVSSSTEGSYSSAWVGIGGFNNGDLIQGGTEQDYTDPPINQPNYYVWWDMLPDYSSSQVISNFPVNPGDEMYVSITYNQSQNCASFYYEDVTSQKYTDFCALHASDDYTTGPSAEWVVERTQQYVFPNNEYPPLANYAATPVAFALGNAVQGQNNPWEPIGSFSNQSSMDMIGCDYGTLLATGGNLTSQSTFTDTWKHYGYWDLSGC